MMLDTKQQMGASSNLFKHVPNSRSPHPRARWLTLAPQGLDRPHDFIQGRSSQTEIRILVHRPIRRTRPRHHAKSGSRRPLLKLATEYCWRTYSSYLHIKARDWSRATAMWNTRKLPSAISVAVHSPKPLLLQPAQTPHRNGLGADSVRGDEAAPSN
jgi:hypothetical protein